MQAAQDEVLPVRRCGHPPPPPIRSPPTHTRIQQARTAPSPRPPPPAHLHQVPAAVLGCAARHLQVLLLAQAAAQSTHGRADERCAGGAVRQWHVHPLREPAGVVGTQRCESPAAQSGGGTPSAVKKAAYICGADSSTLQQLHTPLAKLTKHVVARGPAGPPAERGLVQVPGVVGGCDDHHPGLVACAPLDAVDVGQELVGDAPVGAGAAVRAAVWACSSGTRMPCGQWSHGSLLLASPQYQPLGPGGHVRITALVVISSA
jgi:hypothetical protein